MLKGVKNLTNEYVLRHKYQERIKKLDVKIELYKMELDYYEITRLEQESLDRINKLYNNFLEKCRVNS